jgi:hypothetical protein
VAFPEPAFGAAGKDRITRPPAWLVEYPRAQGVPGQALGDSVRSWIEVTFCAEVHRDSAAVTEARAQQLARGRVKGRSRVEVRTTHVNRDSIEAKTALTQEIAKIRTYTRHVGRHAEEALSDSKTQRIAIDDVHCLARADHHGRERASAAAEQQDIFRRTKNAGHKPDIRKRLITIGRRLTLICPVLKIQAGAVVEAFDNVDDAKLS